MIHVSFVRSLIPGSICCMDTVPLGSWPDVRACACEEVRCQKDVLFAPPVVLLRLPERLGGRCATTQKDLWRPPPKLAAIYSSMHIYPDGSANSAPAHTTSYCCPEACLSVVHACIHSSYHTHTLS
jgi:hypothetical protein